MWVAEGELDLCIENNKGYLGRAGRRVITRFVSSFVPLTRREVQCRGHRFDLLPTAVETMAKCFQSSRLYPPGSVYLGTASSRWAGGGCMKCESTPTSSKNSGQCGRIGQNTLSRKLSSTTGEALPPAAAVAAGAVRCVAAPLTFTSRALRKRACSKRIYGSVKTRSGVHQKGVEHVEGRCEEYIGLRGVMALVMIYKGRHGRLVYMTS